MIIPVHGPELLFILFFFGTLVIGILSTLFWVWMLVDCSTKEPVEGNTKLIWILIILLTHFIGALIYYIVRRPERMRLVGR